MQGATFTANKVKYIIIESTMMNDPFTGELVDAIRYREEKTTNDTPRNRIMSEEMFFERVHHSKINLAKNYGESLRK